MKHTITYLSDSGIKNLKEIDLNEYEGLKKSREFILFYYSFEELFDVVRINVYEFWKLYFEVSEKFRLKMISTKDEIIKPISFFNQKLSNMLSSFRSYDDHLKRKISDSDVNNEVTLNYYRGKCREVYNKYFSFRFFSRLRNFVQHYNFPISKIIYHTGVIENYHEHFVKLIVLKNDLLKFKGWSKVKSEIEKLEEEIDIKEFLNEFLYALSFLHKIMRTYYLDHFWDAEIKLNTIKELCLEDNFENYKKKPTNLDVVYINQLNEEAENEMLWLPITRLLDIRKYFKKNESHENIKESYSTNK